MPVAIRKRVSNRPAIAAVAALLISLPALARDWTAEDVIRLKRVTGAKIAPDGKLIAYTQSVPRPVGSKDDGPAYTELHVVDLEGKVRVFIAGKNGVSGIEWTPDGRGISFRAKRGEDKENSLYVIPIDGGEARRVLSHTTGIGDYDWHPDGKRVAFVSTEKEPKVRKNNKERGFSQEIYEEEWRYSQLWIGEIETDAQQVEASDDKERHKQVNVEGHITDPHWSPDGKRLLVLHAPTPSVDDEMMYRRLRIVNPESGEVETKIENPGKIEQIDWSPDSKSVAMVSAADINDSSAGRLMVASAATGDFKDVLPTLEGHVKSFAWQNADTLMYVADIGVHTTLAKVDADGENAKTLVEGSGPILGAIDLAADGQSAAFTADAPGHPAEVFYMKHADTAPRRLTDSNPWLADMPLARQEVIWWNARDGLKLQGVLFHPAGEETGTRYPLIIVVHGGPEAHDSNGWLTRYANPTQLLCQRGYAVLFPNYRGSTGRGVTFSKMDQHDYAGKEFDDLVDAIDHLDKLGLIDRKKVGVTGGSYGGFATAWCSTALTEHFAAGVMFVGISDLVSKVGTTDIPNEMMLVHARVWPWEDWNFFRDRSPITHAQKSQTPLLILHGKDDPRVHPTQSMELYRYLKILGKTVRLVWYPGEGHGNRKVGAQYDYCMRMIQWMDHYLKGTGGTPPAPEIDYGLKSDKASKDADAD